MSYDLVQKVKSENVFFGKRIRGGFWVKIEQSFRQEQFCPRTHHIAHLAQKGGMGRFHQKIPNENVFFWMDETSFRDTFAPSRAI